MHTAYLSIGANMGDKLAHLNQAITALKADPAIDVTAVSPFYQTEPVGGVVQDDFLNGAVALDTSLSPEGLLDVIQKIEQQQHRVRKIHWGPRTIDLDIIFYDQETCQTPQLTLPHREAFNRRFVLVPLLDILPKRSPYYQKVVSAQQALGDSQRLQVFNGA